MTADATTAALYAVAIIAAGYLAWCLRWLWRAAQDDARRAQEPYCRLRQNGPHDDATGAGADGDHPDIGGRR